MDPSSSIYPCGLSLDRGACFGIGKNLIFVIQSKAAFSA